MKYVILSADNELKVYLVPDYLAESRRSFEKRCLDFSMNIVHDRIQAQGKDWYNEQDFIDCLNEEVCTEEKCVFVETLGWDVKKKKWPEKYRKCYWVNF